ncbi:MAG: ABC transporter substrate-binding protein [Proteobacteria bacterium]|nr:ABC transporter substrate-binding protein [Pseudomonadota bacterium]
MAKDLLKVLAATSGVYYYPAYVAHDLGCFADEGLEVALEAPGHGPWGARALLAGAADIALGGMWRPLMYRGRIADFSVFAQLCARCPAFILGRRPMPDFAWSDLVGKRVIVPDGAPTPLLAILGILRRRGVDPKTVNFIQDFLAEEARELFLNGLGDFCVAFPPVAEALVERGAGHVVADLAGAAGRLPWSVYFATPAFLDRPGNPAGRFTRAILRALRWTLGHEAGEVPATLARHFPGSRPDLAAAAVRACRARGVWVDGVHVAKPDLDLWQEMIIEGHLMDRPVPHGDIFDPRPADWAAASLGAGE